MSTVYEPKRCCTFHCSGILSSSLQVLQKLSELSRENTAFATTLIITVPFKGLFTCAVQLNALQSISQKLLQQCLWNSSNGCLTDSGPFGPFQKRLTSISSFCASLLQMTDAVTSLALGLQVISQAPQCFRSSKKQYMYGCTLQTFMSKDIYHCKHKCTADTSYMTGIPPSNITKNWETNKDNT